MKTDRLTKWQSCIWLKHKKAWEMGVFDYTSLPPGKELRTGIRALKTFYPIWEACFNAQTVRNQMMCDQKSGYIPETGKRQIRQRFKYYLTKMKID